MSRNKKSDGKRRPYKLQLSGSHVMSFGILVTVGVVVLFTVLVLVLIRLDVIPAPTLDFLNLMFDKKNSTDGSEAWEDDSRLNFGTDIGGSELQYFRNDETPAELLESVVEISKYTRDYRVLYSSDDHVTVKRFRLGVDGDDRVLVGEDFTVTVADGAAVMKYGEREIPLSDSVFTFYSEAEITSLEQVKKYAETGQVTVNSANDRTLLVSSLDEETGIRREFIVAVESGIVLSEKFSYNNDIYRVVLTDTIDLFADDIYDMIP